MRLDIYVLVPTHRTFAILWMGGPSEPGRRHALCMWIHELGSFKAKMAPEEVLLRNLSPYDGSKKKIYIVEEKKKQKTKKLELWVGLLCCRMFCVAKTFLLCTRWSFLWYVWTYCMCYYLTHFLNVWPNVRNAEMHHLDGFVPIWKTKSQIKVIFKNDFRLRYVFLRSAEQQRLVFKQQKRGFNMLHHVWKILALLLW